MAHDSRISPALSTVFLSHPHRCLQRHPCHNHGSSTGSVPPSRFFPYRSEQQAEVDAEIEETYTHAQEVLPDLMKWIQDVADVRVVMNMKSDFWQCDRPVGTGLF